MKAKKELLLLGGALAACVLLAELALRMHFVFSYETSLAEVQTSTQPPPAGAVVTLGRILRVSSEPRVVYEMMPNVDVRFRGASLRTNSRGWREEEIDPAKAPGTVRLVGIGDSVMFGWGVQQHERYLDRLEKRLNNAHPERRWETVNMAVPGYNLVMEVEALKHHGVGESPDLILVGFSVNDFCLPNFVLAGRSAWSGGSFLKLYLDRGRSALPQLVERLDILERAPETSGQPKGTRFFETYCDTDNVPRDLESLVGPEHFLAALSELVEIGRRRHIPIILLHHGIGQGYVPLGDADPKAPAEISRALKAVTMTDGLQVIDLAAELRRRNQISRQAPPLTLSDDDPHPSVRGHSLIAKALAERLEDSAVIDRLLAASEPSPFR